MDRVYEKALPEERLFGILPNCSHAYCVGCIRKWRRSRDFQSAVIKACPECRITSSYYIPHKYWISDVGEKEKLIRTFRARTGKIRCKFFVRNRGRCPFMSDCIYLHELPTSWRPRHRRQQQPRMPVEFIPSSSESSGEEDE
ncbi:MKRN1 ligase, partial [Serilophus lunatus]|nr:MKRN1 ligase [Serilophus lunatus]